MPKIIALQSTDPTLRALLHEQGYTVIDMYEAHRKRELVDAYLYTTYHPDALNSYHSVAEPTDIILENEGDIEPLPSTLMLNISDLQPEQVLLTLGRRL